MPTFNTDLAERTLTQIKDEPSTWNQELWVDNTRGCGTAYCFAGHALAQLGYKTAFHRNDLAGYEQALCMVAPNGRVVDVADTARKKLGLSLRRSSDLFSGHNSIDDLERLVKDYANEPDSSDEYVG